MIFSDSFRLLGKKGLFWSIAGLLFSLVMAAAEYAVSILVMALLFVFDLAGPSSAESVPFGISDMSRGAILIALLGAAVFRSFCQLASAQAGHTALEMVRLRLRLSQAREMLRGNDGRPIPASRVNLRMGELIPKTSDFIYHGVGLSVSLFHATAIAAGMFYFAWRESIAGVLCLAALGFAVLRLNRHLADISRRVAEQRNGLEKCLVRVTNNWLLVRVLDLKDSEYKIFENSAAGYFRLALKSFFFVNTLGVLPRTMAAIVFVMIVHANASFFGTPAANLAGFFYLFARFVQTVAEISGHVGMMNNYRFHYDECVKLFRSVPDKDLEKAFRDRTFEGLRTGSRKTEANAGMKTTGPTTNGSETEGRPKAPPEISIDRVSFSWPGMARPLFENLSLKIEAGSCLGVVGPNGCGKSTLLGIVLGVIRPVSGKVAVNGMPAKDYFKRSLSVGYVATDPFLTQASVRENLLYGNRGTVSMKQIERVLEQVGLDEIVGKLEGGLDYRLTEKGEGISSGQRQLLAFARALLRDPDLLVCDEGAANLDIEKETKITGILSGMKGKCTLIVVSNKPGLLKAADRILDLGVVSGFSKPAGDNAI